MAIIKCPHCKKETISASDKCINCGKEISQYNEQSPVKNDKKIYIAIICVLLLLIISLIVIFVIVPAIKNNSSKTTSVQIENTEITITTPLVTTSEPIFTKTTILMPTTSQPTTTISTTTTTVTIIIPEPTNMITVPIIQTPTDPWFVKRENSPLRYVCWGDSIETVKEIEEYQGTDFITEDLQIKVKPKNEKNRKKFSEEKRVRQKDRLSSQKNKSGSATLTEHHKNA